jgi:hypothetical protein
LFFACQNPCLAAWEMLASAILLHNDVEYVIPRYLYGEQHFLTHSCCQSNDGILYMCLPSSSLILTNNLPNSLQVDFFYPVDDSFSSAYSARRKVGPRYRNFFHYLDFIQRRRIPPQRGRTRFETTTKRKRESEPSARPREVTQAVT